MTPEVIAAGLLERLAVVQGNLLPSVLFVVSR
ncbi:MAG: hypothetical protein JWM34_3225 [Ilumatobacteraceae bacterium]|nr:hypothetical protein [Ilumatobacteraceae bacterium]